MSTSHSLATNEPTYEVAISFPSADEKFAKALFDRLSEILKVFFFPRNQEDLVGTNGLESMREPFFDTRVVVVIYGALWGKTPWTRVEETAICDRSLKKGWSGLVFVHLDKANALPRWLPETHVRFSSQDYGIEELVGIVKARVVEQGGSIAPPDAMSMAKRIAEEKRFIDERARMMRDENWISQVVHKCVSETMQEIVILANAAKEKFGWQLVYGADNRRCVLRTDMVSLTVDWSQRYTNSVLHSSQSRACIQVREFSGAIALPGERAIFLYSPKTIAEHIFKPDISQLMELVWLEDDKLGQIATSRLAERIFMIFLDLVSRSHRGETESPPL